MNRRIWPTVIILQLIVIPGSQIPLCYDFFVLQNLRMCPPGYFLVVGEVSGWHRTSLATSCIIAPYVKSMAMDVYAVRKASWVLGHKLE